MISRVPGNSRVFSGVVDLGDKGLDVPATEDITFE